MDYTMNNYKVQMLFPVCLHDYVFDEFDEEGLIKFCYEQKEKDSEGQVKSNRGGWHSSFFDIRDENIISTHLKRGLGKSIFTCLNPNFGVEVTYWIMINPPNTYNTSHTHPEAHLSGVMWIKIPKNSGDISFNNPFEFTGYIEAKSYIEEVRNQTGFHASYIVHPKSGKMITFPSSLRHEVKVNESDEDRIAVSYNIRISNVN